MREFLLLVFGVSVIAAFSVPAAQITRNRVRWLLLLAGLIAVGCGGGTPTSPSAAPSTAPAPSPTPPAPPPPAPPAPPTFTGTVTNTVTGAPVAGFTATVSGTRLTVSAPGYVTRETRFGATTVDLIPEAGFELTFYRQFVRGAMDGALYPNFRLMENPSIYMEVEGTKGLSAPTAARLEPVARAVIPALTGGRLQLARWETGPTPRTPQPGWIMIERRDEGNRCGSASVGAIAGQIYLTGDLTGCNLQATLAHEIGHALGFFHVDRQGYLMYPQIRGSNLADAPTDLERRMAAIAYARPRGNRDVDIDP